ncbi:(Fe-S)-binding protein [Methylovirgula sp. HY1]|uniref:(Fe-S)-binding protein n=1 Tax=Methylovirgula sp. HY1 TaxID=2822761 RepID=UPI001C5B3E65|nr:(Fe-S)-binding protein [Methylovirgula sp. HY1]QXX76532.1 hypothetical protein MHY1_p00054 [Methylovirgula sp. HY1]
MLDMNAFRQFGQALANLGKSAKRTQIDADEQVRRAKDIILEKLDRDVAMDLDACVHCGYCAEACQFAIDTDDPKLVPTRKLDLMRRVYRREASPLAPLRRIFTRDISAEELAEWELLCFDNCTECGRCTTICPMGINIARGVGIMREALSAAGHVPAEILALQQEQQDKGTFLGAGSDQLHQAIEIVRGRGIEVHLDKPKADVLLLSTAPDILLFHDALAATAKVLNAAKMDWTLRSEGFEAGNFGMLSGVLRTERKATEAIIQQALEIGAKMVIVPECGHAYPALRWVGAEVHGAALPFRIVAISELLGELVADGRIRLKPDFPQKVFYHDACQLGRRGGIFDEPRTALKAMGADVRDSAQEGVLNWCCGGGGGNSMNTRAAPQRARAFEIKRRQVETSGAEALVLSCASCRMTLLGDAQIKHWDMPLISLVELAGEHLDDTHAASSQAPNQAPRAMS